MTSADPLLAASALGGLLERLANTALELDAVSQARLARLDGKALRVVCTVPPLAAELRFTGDGLRVRGVPPEDAGQTLADAGVDTILRGPGSAVVALLLGSGRGNDPVEALLGSGLAVEGDTALAGELAAIASGLEPDIESPLAPLLGERNAMLVGSAARSLAGLLREAAGFAGRQAEATVRQVAGAALADPAQVQRFLDDVDDLRSATDRVEARLQALHQRVAAAAGGTAAGTGGAP